jgi:hypothetical protein
VNDRLAREKRNRAVVVLDFDGVLVIAPNHRNARQSCVKALNRITGATGAVIVVSSAWRLSFELVELQGLLKTWEVKGEVVGTTPILNGLGWQPYIPREVEIRRWLIENPTRHFVIIDDDPDAGKGLRDRCILTDGDVGLCRKHVGKAIGILRRPYRGTFEIPTCPCQPEIQPRLTTGVNRFEWHDDQGVYKTPGLRKAHIGNAINILREKHENVIN